MAARIAVVLPAGMAAKITDTPATTPSTRHSTHAANTARGMRTSLITEKTTVIFVTMVFKSAPAIMEPMRSMVTGVVLPLKLARVLLKNPGSLI